MKKIGVTAILMALLLTECLEKDKIGEISSHAAAEAPFKDGAANALPLGTEIYSVNEREDVYILKGEGETKRYLQLLEG